MTPQPPALARPGDDQPPEHAREHAHELVSRLTDRGMRASGAPNVGNPSGVMAVSVQRVDVAASPAQPLDPGKGGRRSQFHAEQVGDLADEMRRREWDWTRADDKADPASEVLLLNRPGGGCDPRRAQAVILIDPATSRQGCGLIYAEPYFAWAGRRRFIAPAEDIPRAANVIEHVTGHSTQPALQDPSGDAANQKAPGHPMANDPPGYSPQSANECDELVPVEVDHTVPHIARTGALDTAAPDAMRGVSQGERVSRRLNAAFGPGRLYLTALDAVILADEEYELDAETVSDGTNPPVLRVFRYGSPDPWVDVEIEDIGGWTWLRVVDGEGIAFVEDVEEAPQVLAAILDRKADA